MDTARGGTGAAVLLAVLLAGCSSGGGESSATPEPTLPDIDPPLAFADGIWLDDGYQADALHVDGTVLYTYREESSAITTWDMATGTERETVTVDLDGGTPRAGREGSPYAFTDIDGRLSLVVAYEHFARGVGTRPSEYHLRVQAFHADDGSLAWDRDVDGIPTNEIRILASDTDHTVVVSGARNPAARTGRVEPSVEGATTVLETATGQVRDVVDPFVAYALDRDVIAGLRPDLDEGTHAIEGRHLYTGETVWEYPDARPGDADYFGSDLGGGVLLQPARSRAAETATLATNLLLEVGTGDLLLEVDHGGAAVECHYDGEQILACGEDPDDRGDPLLAAYDLHSGTQLWDGDEIGAGRDLPDVIATVYQGVLYMDFTSAGRRPMALDGRTGEDLAVDLPVAPDQVGTGYGLTHEELGDIWIYPATDDAAA